MKKYIQLSLVLVALTCFLFMAVYHRKYTKVKVVLDVLNGYRTAYNVSLDETRGPESTTIPSNEKFDPILRPRWDEVAPGVHVYSAFAVENSNFINGPHVRVLTLIQGRVPNELNCMVYFESKKEPVTVMAHTVTLLETMREEDKRIFLLAMCPLSDGKEKPYAVGLSTPSPTGLFHSFGSIQVTKPTQTLHRKFVACVEPLSVGSKDVYSLIELLVYYNSIGVDHFVIYEQGVSDSVHKLLLESRRNFSIDVLPWNLPFGSADVSEVSFFTDCLYRSAFAFNDTYVLKINTKEFLLLKKDKSLPALLEHVSLSKSQEYLPVYSFRTHVFCSEFPNDVVAKALSFPFITQKKFKRIESDTPNLSLIFHIMLSWLTENLSTLKLVDAQHGVPVRKVPSEMAVVHTYPVCDTALPKKFMKNTVEDRNMFQYKSLFFKSQLYKTFSL